MRKTVILTLLLLAGCLLSQAQNARTTLTITAKSFTTTTFTDKEVIVNGQTDLHLTSTTKPLINSIINLNSENSWLFVDNFAPSYAIDSLLQYIYVNGQAAVNKTNIRVAIYKAGAVIIPQSSNYQPLTVFNGQTLSGDSAKYSLYTFNTALGAFDNKIRSFRLKRGYMVTLATATDGTGYSRVYIADNEDLIINTLPDLLDKKISFIRVFNWEWVSKKGWCGYNPTDINLVKPTWRYDWSAGGASTANVEYVPIRQNGGWPGWAEISGKQGVTHVLGFNEPDHTEQSNLTVSQAVAQWPEMLKTGLRIGSPACTNFTWLYQFMDSCKLKNYRVDYVAVHAYWGGKSPANWYNDLKYIHDRTGRPIWITEWNNGANWTTETWPTTDHSLSTANAAKQLSDLKAILQVLDTAHFIERYSIYNWVQDCRAMVLNNALTPAGEYYAADKSVVGFQRINEVLPTFYYNNPSSTISFGTKKLTVNVVDPNAENFNGFIVEKKTDNGTYSTFFDSSDPSLKTCSDTIDINAASKTRYRLKSKFASGGVSSYTNEVGFDVTTGTDLQCGTIGFNNVAWNAVFFKQPYTSPVIIFGSPTNNNPSVLMSNRVKLVSNTTRFNFQFSPWAYQGVTSLTKDENISYFIMNAGTYDLGGLKTIAARASNIGPTWSSITFSTPFDTIPVVLTTQLNPLSTNASTVRVRNISKTGFEVKLQKETKVTTALAVETISYLAIAQGKGSYNGNQIIVSKTPASTVGLTTYSTIAYGDSIVNPVFLPQMQTCNDDTVTAALRCLTVGVKSSNLIKQREKSMAATNGSAETVGWVLIKPLSTGIETPIASTGIRFYPNPAKDYLYVNSTEELNVDIFNMYGVLVKRLRLDNNMIDIRNLPSGAYIVHTKYGTRKFIKN